MFTSYFHFYISLTRPAKKTRVQQKSPGAGGWALHIANLLFLPFYLLRWRTEDLEEGNSPFGYWGRKHCTLQIPWLYLFTFYLFTFLPFEGGRRTWKRETHTSVTGRRGKIPKWRRFQMLWFWQCKNFATSNSQSRTKQRGNAPVRCMQYARLPVGKSRKNRVTDKESEGFAFFCTNLNDWGMSDIFNSSHF